MTPKQKRAWNRLQKLDRAAKRAIDRSGLAQDRFMKTLADITVALHRLRDAREDWERVKDRS